MKIWHLEREFKKAFGVEGGALVDELKGLALKGEAKGIVEM